MISGAFSGAPTETSLGVRVKGDLCWAAPIAAAIVLLTLFSPSPAKAEFGFLTTWGAGATNFGRLFFPPAATVDRDGNVYVADSYNNRIVKFDSSGNFLAKWGKYGTGDGRFNYPFGIAVDAFGDVYVSDSSNYRIQKFDSSGAFQRMWGWGVRDGANEFQICTSSCRAGIRGDGDGQLYDSFGVAADSQGDVYVADTSNDRIQKFDSSGNFQRMWGWGVRDGANEFQICTSSCRAGIWGDGDGQLYDSLGVAADSQGDVYVADTSNDRIQKFDSSGNFLAKWGEGGTGEGQFSTPAGVAADSSGAVYVSDASNDVSSNSRIQKFDSNGAFQRMWGWGVRDGANEFQICTSSCRAGIQGDGDGQLYDPYGVAAGSDGDVYVADSYNNRVQKFDASGSFRAKWGSERTADGWLDKPVGVAADSSGDVYVADAYNNRIQKFDSSGNFRAKWGASGTGEGQFSNPVGIAVDSSGAVYVSDASNILVSSNNRIQKFDSSGAFQRMWGWGVRDGANEFQICTSSCRAGIQGDGDGQLYDPYGVAADSDGDVYVADTFNDRIQKFDASGNFLAKWGEGGAGDGELSEPNGVAVDSRRDVYVADSYNNRIQKFDASGNFLAKWGRAGTSDGRFNYPFGVSVDLDGDVYVGDAFNNRIQKFNASGNFLAKWGEYGVGTGQFNSPYGVTVDSEGDVYIADMGNNRIQKFGELPEATPIPGLPQPPPPAFLPVAGPERSAADAHKQACNLKLTSPRVKEVGSPSVEVSVNSKGRSPKEARQIFTKGLRGNVRWGEVDEREVVCKKIRMAILERRDGKYYVPGTSTRVSEKRLGVKSFAKRVVRFLGKRKVGAIKRKRLEDGRKTAIFFREFRSPNRSRLGKKALKTLARRHYRGSFVVIYTAEVDGTTIKKTLALP